MLYEFQYKTHLNFYLFIYFFINMPVRQVFPHPASVKKRKEEGPKEMKFIGYFKFLINLINFDFY
jgi:hypothetical protein